MSDLSELIEGKLSPGEFVPKAAADLKKDFAIFQGLPFAATVEGWALDALQAFLSSKLSPTFAALVVNEVRATLATTPPV